MLQRGIPEQQKFKRKRKSDKISPNKEIWKRIPRRKEEEYIEEGREGEIKGTMTERKRR